LDWIGTVGTVYLCDGLGVGYIYIYIYVIIIIIIIICALVLVHLEVVVLEGLFDFGGCRLDCQVVGPNDATDLGLDLGGVRVEECGVPVLGSRFTGNAPEGDEVDDIGGEIPVELDVLGWASRGCIIGYPNFSPRPNFSPVAFHVIVLDAAKQLYLEIGGVSDGFESVGLAANGFVLGDVPVVKVFPEVGAGVVAVDACKLGHVGAQGRVEFESEHGRGGGGGGWGDGHGVGHGVGHDGWNRFDVAHD
jgi:hypothetical protein